MTDPKPSRLEIEGALWYLDLCAGAVRVQERRVLLKDGVDRIVEVWLTLTALRNAVRAVHLAKRVAPSPPRIEAALKSFEEQSVINARDVFEHFDDYFFGKGKLQQPGSAHLSTQVAVNYEEDRIESVTVTVGHDVVQIPKATKGLDDLLWEVREELRGSLS